MYVFNVFLKQYVCAPAPLRVNGGPGRSSGTCIVSPPFPPARPADPHPGRAALQARGGRKLSHGTDPPHNILLVIFNFQRGYPGDRITDECDYACWKEKLCIFLKLSSN